MESEKSILQKAECKLPLSRVGGCGEEQKMLTNGNQLVSDEQVLKTRCVTSSDKCAN